MFRSPAGSRSRVLVGPPEGRIMGIIDRPSMLRLLAPLLLLGSVLQGALLAPAKAHQIESALQYLDGDLQLSSSFSNGEPTQAGTAAQAGSALSRS